MADFTYLDELLESFVENGLPGCGCAVAKDGEIIYESYHGWADVAHKRKTDENTVYRLYSMTKVIIMISRKKEKESDTRLVESMSFTIYW